MASGDRLHRLFEIIRLLQSGRTYNSLELSEACQVSRRTVFRDIKTLANFGIHVERDGEPAGYRLGPDSALPVGGFTSEETLSLLILCEELAQQTHGVPFQEAARTAAAKLLSNLPEHVQTRINEMRSSISVHLSPHNTLSNSQRICRQITESLIERQQARIVYQSPPDADPVTLDILPYHILFKNRSWHVIARSLQHQEVRTFHIARISDVEILPNQYNVPKSFRLYRYLGNAWSLIREPHEQHDILVRFQPLVAQNVAEVHWHKTQKLLWNEDGSLDFQVTVEGLAEISWWILGYGDQAEVIKPTKLRKEIERRIEAMQGIYQRSSDHES